MVGVSRLAVRSVAWVIVSVMGILILWALAVPWSQVVPVERDVDGLWRYLDSSGHKVNMQLQANSTAELSGWPDSVGCGGPLQAPERLLEDVDWRATSVFRGEWMLRSDFEGLSLHMVSSSPETCRIDIPLRMQRNIFTGEERMLFFGFWVRRTIPRSRIHL